MENKKEKTPPANKIFAILNKLELSEAVEVYNHVGVFLHEKIDNRSKQLQELKTNLN